MNTLQDEWEAYKACLPPNAGAVQIAETERAFYAGAISYANLVLKFSAPGVDEEVSLALTGTLFEEMQAFEKRIQQEVLEYVQRSRKTGKAPADKG